MWKILLLVLLVNTALLEAKKDKDGDEDTSVEDTTKSFTTRSSTGCKGSKPAKSMCPRRRCVCKKGCRGDVNAVKGCDENCTMRCPGSKPAKCKCPENSCKCIKGYVFDFVNFKCVRLEDCPDQVTEDNQDNSTNITTPPTTVSDQVTEDNQDNSTNITTPPTTVSDQNGEENATTTTMQPTSDTEETTSYTTEVTTESAPEECPEAMERFRIKTTIFQTNLISYCLKKNHQLSFIGSGMATTFFIILAYIYSEGRGRITLSELLGIESTTEAICICRNLNIYVNNLPLDTLLPSTNILAGDEYPFTNAFMEDMENIIIGKAFNLNLNISYAGDDSYVNELVYNQTKGRITNIITSKNTPQIDTQIGFLSGLFYSAYLQIGLQPELLTETIFYVAPLVRVKTNYIRQKIKCKYVDSYEVGAKIIEIPYEGNKTSLLIVLPFFKYTEKNVAAKLSNQNTYDSVIKRMKEYTVLVEMPCINITSMLNTVDLIRQTGFGSSLLNESTIELNNAIVGNKEAILTYGFQKNIFITPSNITQATSSDTRIKRTTYNKIFTANCPFLILLTCPGLNGIVLMSGAVVNPNNSTGMVN